MYLAGTHPVSCAGHREHAGWPLGIVCRAPQAAGADASAGCDEQVAVVERVLEAGQAGIGLRRGGIDVGGALHGEGLMRPLGVELVDEGVEAFLLLDGVAGGRPGGMLLQGEVHALASTVLLGVSEFDALEPQAEAEPPAGELGQTEEAVLAKGRLLSVRMACGSPRSWKMRSKAAMTGCSRVDSKAHHCVIDPRSLRPAVDSPLIYV